MSTLPELFMSISLYGDIKAFEQLFRQQHERLYRFSFQYVQNQQVAEEVVNDVFVKIWKYRTMLHTITNPESYLFIAVKNQSLNYIKKYSHLHISLTEDHTSALLVSHHSPQQDIEYKELQAKLQAVVENLPEACRKIFRLVKEDGLKPRQVAQLLNISVRTVETQLYRAVKRLDAALAQQEKQEGQGFGSSGKLFTGILLVGSLFF